MSQDISKILDQWEFDPHQQTVRVIIGDDGKEKLQLRLDMGMLQMNFNGRPDGQRPEGAESWLDFYRDKLARYDAAHPDGPPFLLESVDCERLLREGMQYYHRYLAFWNLHRYELCARDTNRNLRLFAFVREHARHQQDKLQFDQWRPYVIMMHTRAVATPLVEIGDKHTAIQTIDAGIQGIRDFLDEYDQAERAEEVAELQNLQRWREQLEAKEGGRLGDKPPSWISQLNVELTKAIEEERFEDAAALRDRIRKLSPDGLPQPPSTGN